ncbi:4-phosphopantetheinyl transferase family protein [Micromonospora sp. KC207]|uniref:4'-phosphopantetheinyl transferase family protein n=1 Tax=Micromonospora sp. KC207 TaxID=2530377 RepID=UPI00104849ED|nr:4'-phosphopantetheinyl transferase superfamily protein [Micromonospora sp. KC207]TDC60889.1 4-phosphopantetheinyl transferase family protein [Micromonospora sp. KC207]
MSRVRVLIARTTAPPCPAAGAAPAAARRRDQAASREALRRVLVLLGREPQVTGRTFPHRTVSLTHCPAGGGAAAVDDPVLPEVVGVGVDLETDRPLPRRAARYFCTADELAFVDALPPTDRSAQLLRLWTVKEALFKSDPENAHTALRRYQLPVPAAAGGVADRRGGTRRLAFVYASRRWGAEQLSVALALTPQADRPAYRPTHRSEVSRPVDIAARVAAAHPDAPGRPWAGTPLVGLVGLVLDLPAAGPLRLPPRLQPLRTVAELTEFLNPQLLPS